MIQEHFLHIQEGLEIDVDDYISFLNSIDDNLYIAAQVDKIPGRFRKPKTRAEIENASIESWKNYLYMVERLKSPKKLLPIFHQGENFKYLEQILNYRYKDGSKIWYIGISPANDVSVNLKDEWLNRVYTFIKNSSNPEVNTHLFGMTSLNLLEKYPATSADSTTFKIAAAYGNIITPYGILYKSSRGEFLVENIDNKSDEELQVMKNYFKKIDINFEELGVKQEERILANIKFIENWKKENEYKNSILKNKKRLF